MNAIEKMPEHYKVWVYMASRPLTAKEENKSIEQIQQFLKNWKSHGTPLEGSVEILYHTYIIVAGGGENIKPGGCSGDELDRQIKELGRSFEIDFFNRMQVGYFENEQFTHTPLHQFWAKRKAGIIHDDTPVVNVLVKNVGEWKAAWIQHFKDSWHQEMWSN